MVTFTSCFGPRRLRGFTVIVPKLTRVRVLTWTLPYALCCRPAASAYLVSCIWCAPIYCVIIVLRHVHGPQPDISLARTEDSVVIVLSHTQGWQFDPA
ncbi:hypothetical protein BJV78DRAFT_1247915, partial [Lactifluus subvellereus]